METRLAQQASFDLQVGTRQWVLAQPAWWKIELHALPGDLQADRWQWLVAAPTMQHHRQTEQGAQAACRADPALGQAGKRVGRE